MSSTQQHNNHHNLLILAEEATVEVVDQITSLLPSWHCHKLYDWDELIENTVANGELKAHSDNISNSLDISKCPAIGVFAMGQNPDEHTLILLEEALKATPNTAWVAILTDQNFQNRQLMTLVVAYCQDYMTYPFRGIEEIFGSMLGHVKGMARLRKSQLNQGLAPSKHHTKYNMVGKSKAIKNVFTLIEKYAKSDAAVMISGESGTGKELIALAIHEDSPRADKPFIAVNCGAIPENLLESELFGHIKGAFTGAIQNRDGRIALADTGTLFLDEIGDLSLGQQVKILRFLQEGTFEPVGSSHTQVADVRIITASHVDMEHAIAKKLFREDLYYRLNVLQLTAPPLREHNADIELLARHYLEEFTLGRADTPKGFSPEALQAMALHDWPGNVRELINRVQKATIVSDHALIAPQDLGFEKPRSSTQSGIVVNLQETRNKAEREALETTLQSTQFNVSKTAQLLGISRMTIYRLMEKHSISMGLS